MPQEAQGPSQWCVSMPPAGGEEKRQLECLMEGRLVLAKARKAPQEGAFSLYHP